MLEQFIGVPCVVRDEDLVLRWCNDAYVRLGKTSKRDLMGSRMESLMSSKAAGERGGVMRRVLDSGIAARYYQFASDQRLVCDVIPLDAGSFGYRGVMITLQRTSGLGESDEAVPVLRTPCLDELAVLSPAELRVLLHLGKGRTTAEIGQHLSRSAKTVEKQIESVHRKLGTGSRAELVRLAVERGLQAFRDEDWEQIIEGSREVRRTGPQTTN